MRFNRRLWFWCLLPLMLVGGVIVAFLSYADLSNHLYSPLLGICFGIVCVFAAVHLFIKAPSAVEIKGKEITLYSRAGKVKLKGIRSILHSFGLEGRGDSVFIVHSKGTTQFIFDGFSDDLLRELNKVKPVEEVLWPFKNKKRFNSKKR